MQRTFSLLWFGWTVFWVTENAGLYLLRGEFDNLVAMTVMFWLGCIYLMIVRRQALSRRASPSEEQPPEKAS